tara:strand:- start:248 stop:451 length:204 start_codon:yes stop_codon:yes gene_type:complete
MPLDATEAAQLTVDWLTFADALRTAAESRDGAERDDGELRRFSKSELRTIARSAAQLVAHTLIDVLD